MGEPKYIALVSLSKGSGCPPMGLVYLGTYLQKLGHTVEILDNNMPIIKSGTKPYDVIGFSAMTYQYDDAILLGKLFKEGKAKRIIGGVHISTCPESFDPEAFDYMFKGRVVSEEVRPNWDLVNQEYFKEQPDTTFGEFGVSGVLMTSLGCPYECIFCSTKAMWGNPIFFSPQYVADCIQDLKDRGVTHIQIWDDLFTINKKRIKEIMLLKPRGIKYNCQPRTNLIDQEMCDLLKDFGVTLCIFGFESGSEKIIKYLKAGSTSVEQNKRAIDLCLENGLNVQGSVVFGSPNETYKDALETLDFMNWCYNRGVQRIWSFNLTPFPNTRIWEDKWFGKWKELSHTSKPLLTKIPQEEYNEIMSIAKEIENKFQRRKTLLFLKNNPIKTLKYGLTHYSEIINISRTHT